MRTEKISISSKGTHLSMASGDQIIFTVYKYFGNISLNVSLRKTFCNSYLSNFTKILKIYFQYIFTWQKKTVSIYIESSSINMLGFFFICLLKSGFAKYLAFSATIFTITSWVESKIIPVYIHWCCFLEETTFLKLYRQCTRKKFNFLYICFLSHLLALTKAVPVRQEKYLCSCHFQIET